MPSPEIQIRTFNAKSAGERLLSVLEQNLDSEKVSINHIPMAVKSLDPVEIFVVAVSGFVLEEFLLKPLIGPLAEKWQEQVKQFFTPFHSFSIEISFQDSKNKIITDPPVTSLNGMFRIWSVIGVVRRLTMIHKLDADLVKIVSDGQNAPYALVYKQTKCLWRIEISSEKVITLPP